jgi:hypothetical protein
LGKSSRSGAARWSRDIWELVAEWIRPSLTGGNKVLFIYENNYENGKKKEGKTGAAS